MVGEQYKLSIIFQEGSLTNQKASKVLKMALILNWD